MSSLGGGWGVGWGLRRLRPVQEIVGEIQRFVKWRGRIDLWNFKSGRERVSAKKKIMIIRLCGVELRGNRMMG